MKVLSSNCDTQSCWCESLTFWERKPSAGAGIVVCQTVTPALHTAALVSCSPLTQLPTDTSGKVAEDGLSPCVPTTLKGDQNGAPDSRLWPYPDWLLQSFEKEQADGRALRSVAFLLFSNK